MNRKYYSYLFKTALDKSYNVMMDSYDDELADEIKRKEITEFIAKHIASDEHLLDLGNIKIAKQNYFIFKERVLGGEDFYETFKEIFNQPINKHTASLCVLFEYVTKM